MSHPISKDSTSTYDTLLRDSAIQDALAYLKKDHEKTIKEQMEITEIPAPPFKERTRAINFKARLEELGLQDVQMDAEGNVFGIRPGTGKGPKLFITAHLDTVFPEGTDVQVKEKNGILFAPGISDDTRGLAELLGIIRAINHAGITTVGDIIFGGTVGEEGAGDLRGVKAFFSEHEDIDGFISLDGGGPETIVYKGTGSFRYKVTFKGDGGHSFGDFGNPSATHALGRAIAAISDIQTKADPKTTFTVGEVWGGTSVNAIAQEAGMTVDLRSNCEEELHKLEKAFLDKVQDAVTAENSRWDSEALVVELDKFGNRPPASQPDDAPIVRASYGAVEKIIGEPTLADAVSTDANYPMSLGVPSVTLGLGGKAGSAHTLEEWFDPTDAFIGVQKSFLALLGMVGVEGVSQPLLEKS